MKQKILSLALLSFLAINGTQALEKNDLYGEKTNALNNTLGEQQTKHPIKGVIVDEAGLPLVGVTVTIQGATIGTVTDIDGSFSIEAAPDNYIVISYIGFKPQTIQVGNKKEINIKLIEDSELLKEVVVTALGIKREEKALGYAVQKMDVEKLQTVKGVDVTTGLTGKIAGLNILNTTEFGAAPEMKLRGEKPLIVVDGIPYENVTLGDISPDDIEDISVLKGATASALYGSKGQTGAIMVTTKKGKGSDGLSISVNSSSMFTAGYLAIPEVQSTYGRVLKTNTGGALEYVRTADGAWGAPMEGQDVVQWDPASKTMKSMPYLPIGKDNFKNFLEQGYILNNNVSIAQNGKLGNIRASATWVNNKGQYPNSKFNKYTYSIGGNINIDKFSFSSNVSYNKHETPNKGFNGYTGYDPMYGLLIWGAPDWDVTQYKDYWVIPNEEQNSSFTAGVNNPYFDRYERTHSLNKDIFNGSVEVGYEFIEGLKLIGRLGYDSYSNKQQIKVSKGSFQGAGNATLIEKGDEVWGESKKGSYNNGISRNYSINNDWILSFNKTIKDFTIDGLLGAGINYYEGEGIDARTQGGLSIPGYYSLKGSTTAAIVSSKVYKKETNSVYGRLGASYKSLVFIEGTLRNDWVSTLSKSERSYLYPSISGSFIISELLPKTDWLSLWKVRGSVVSARKPADIYEINTIYSISNNVWNGLSSASYQDYIRGNEIKAEGTTSTEIGTAFNFFKNRLGLDFAYFSTDKYDFIKRAKISEASGFSQNLINIDEERRRSGIEISLNATPIENKDWRWNLGINWSKSTEKYTKIDDTYSEDQTWVEKGGRTDVLKYRPYLKNSNGEIVHHNGVIQFNDKSFKYGHMDPDWIWGFNTQVKYKNWQFSMSMDGRVGGYLPSTTSMYMWQAGVHPNSVTSERYLDATVANSKNYVGQGVKVISGSATFDSYGNIISDTRQFAPNDVATTYKAYVQAMHRGTAWGGDASEADILSATFLKIRELSLTYTLPREISSKLKAKDISISAIGQNVLFWAKDFKYSDPDGGSENFADPAVRYLGFNLKLNF